MNEDQPNVVESTPAPVDVPADVPATSVPGEEPVTASEQSTNPPDATVTAEASEAPSVDATTEAPPAEVSTEARSENPPTEVPNEPPSEAQATAPTDARADTPLTEPTLPTSEKKETPSRKSGASKPASAAQKIGSTRSLRGSNVLVVFDGPSAPQEKRTTSKSILTSLRQVSGIDPDVSLTSRQSKSTEDFEDHADLDNQPVQQGNPRWVRASLESIRHSYAAIASTKAVSNYLSHSVMELNNVYSAISRAQSPSQREPEPELTPEEREALNNKTTAFLKQFAILRHAIVKTQKEVRQRLHQRLRDPPSSAQASDGNEEESNQSDYPTRYSNLLTAYGTLMQNMVEDQNQHKTLTEELKSKSETMKKTVEAKHHEFLRYRRRLLLQAVYSRTGKPLGTQAVDHFDHQDRKKDAELAQTVLENIKLYNFLRRQESSMKKKEELAGGLHLIDFEQLKIENQSFTKKIEDRGEECVKLRSKISRMVQTITHVNEKIDCMRYDTDKLAQQLAVVDTEVKLCRDQLPVMKSQRDQMRRLNMELRQKTGLLNNTKLLKDFEKQQERNVQLQNELKRLKEQYKHVIAEQEKARNLQRQTQFKDELLKLRQIAFNEK